MQYTFWLLKTWPVDSLENKAPIIYCLDEEWDEENAKKFLQSQNNKENNYELLQMDGFDTPKEVVIQYELRDRENLPDYVTIKDIVTSLPYKGKYYYFPKNVIIRSHTGLFQFLFPHKHKKGKRTHEIEQYNI